MTDTTPAKATPAAGLPDVAGCSGLVAFGRGPTGVLYRGRQIAHARDVLVRVLESAPGRLPLLREAAQKAQELAHPNVVAVWDVAELGSRTCVVSEFLPGGSLDAKVRAEAPTGLPLQEAFRILSFAAAGLAHVHSRGLVHGAMKPTNVLLGKQAQAKVCDIGAPFDPEFAVTADPAMAGTLHYLSPEQARGEPATTASDVYSLGATLYFALSGRAPYAGTSADEVIANVAEGVPIPLESVRSGLRPDVYALVDAMMSLDPAGRPAAVADIGRCLAAEIVSAIAPAPAAPKPRGKRSSLRNGVWIVAAIAAVVAGVAYVIYERMSRPEELPPAAATVVEDPTQTAAARRLADLLAREKALGPLCASTLDAYRGVADEFGRLAAENSIDDPVVAEAWAHRRELLRSVSAVAPEDEVSTLHVEKWLGAIIDQSNSSSAAAAVPDDAQPHDLAAIMSTRVSEITVVEKLLDEEKYVEGLNRMAAWVVAERALAKARKAGEMERTEIQTGVDWLRTAALGITVRLRADLTVDGEILRAHVAETTCFGGAHSAFKVPDFDRSLARLSAITRLLMTGPARDRVARRRASIEKQAEAFKAAWLASPAKLDRSAPDAWQTAVSTSIQGAFPKLAADHHAGALTLLTETADVDASKAVLGRASLPKGAEGAAVKAECEALEQFATERAVKDAAKRAEALKAWIVKWAQTDASLLLPTRSDAGKCAAAHPGIAAAECALYLAGWGSDAGGGQIRK
ncbi:MAG: serine/threonine protein kinase [Planctomycetes bacterium]|nr:serine/threonine protein kinase [Planctomycetota bacterium]